MSFDAAPRLSDAKWTAGYENLSPLAALRGLKVSGRLESARCGRETKGRKLKRKL